MRLPSRTPRRADDDRDGLAPADLGELVRRYGLARHP